MSAPLILAVAPAYDSVAQADRARVWAGNATDAELVALATFYPHIEDDSYEAAQSKAARAEIDRATVSGHRFGPDRRDGVAPVVVPAGLVEFAACVAARRLAEAASVVAFYGDRAAHFTRRIAEDAASIVRAEARLDRDRAELVALEAALLATA